MCAFSLEGLGIALTTLVLGEVTVGVPGIHVTLGVALVCLLSLIVLLMILRVLYIVVCVYSYCLEYTSVKEGRERERETEKGCFFYPTRMNSYM